MLGSRGGREPLATLPVMVFYYCPAPVAAQTTQRLNFRWTEVSEDFCKDVKGMSPYTANALEPGKKIKYMYYNLIATT